MQFALFLKLENGERNEALGDGPNTEEGVRRHVLVRFNVGLADAADPGDPVLVDQRHTDTGRFGFLQYLADALLQLADRLRGWLFFFFFAIHASRGRQSENEEQNPNRSFAAGEKGIAHASLSTLSEKRDARCFRLIAIRSARGGFRKTLPGVFGP